MRLQPVRPPRANHSSTDAVAYRCGGQLILNSDTVLAETFTPELKGESFESLVPVSADTTFRHCIRRRRRPAGNSDRTVQNRNRLWIATRRILGQNRNR